MNDRRYEIAQAVAREAGQIALDHLESLKNNHFAIEVKGPQDFVTKADRDVEIFIRRKLKASFPEDGLLGEEHGLESGSNELTWVIDPIDGTANYIRRIDQWAISIALVSQHGMEAGVIYDPVRNDLFSAQTGKGAKLNGQALDRVSTDRPKDPIIIVGRSKRKPFDHYLQTLAFLNNKGIEYRRFGSAAMGLAQVAQGLVDGYFEADLNPWDCLAGLLLVEEAGGFVLAGENVYRTLENEPICVSHPYLKETMMDLLAETC